MFIIYFKGCDCILNIYIYIYANDQNMNVRENEMEMKWNQIYSAVKWCVKQNNNNVIIYPVWGILKFFKQILKHDEKKNVFLFFFFLYRPEVCKWK